eukprot:GHVL01010971.1.p1 GENE.GHVL01010971.1~~GHVL01010971.1.p1  ORF type:complete len:1052 (+),score=126.53 GHVL01010971.1:48-3203(+)
MSKQQPKAATKPKKNDQRTVTKKVLLKDKGKQISHLFASLESRNNTKMNNTADGRVSGQTVFYRRFSNSRDNWSNHPSSQYGNGASDDSDTSVANTWLDSLVTTVCKHNTASFRTTLEFIHTNFRGEFSVDESIDLGALEDLNIEYPRCLHSQPELPLLHLCCWAGFIYGIEFLLAAKSHRLCDLPDVHLVDSAGYSAMHRASEGGSWRAIEILIRAGADVNILELTHGSNRIGSTPLILLAELHPHVLGELYRHAERLLEDHKSDHGCVVAALMLVRVENFPVRSSNMQPVDDLLKHVSQLCAAFYGQKRQVRVQFVEVVMGQKTRMNELEEALNSSDPLVSSRPYRIAQILSRWMRELNDAADRMDGLIKYATHGIWYMKVCQANSFPILTTSPRREMTMTPLLRTRTSAASDADSHANSVHANTKKHRQLRRMETSGLRSKVLIPAPEDGSVGLEQDDLDQILFDIDETIEVRKSNNCNFDIEGFKTMRWRQRMKMFFAHMLATQRPSTCTALTLMMPYPLSPEADILTTLSVSRSDQMYRTLFVKVILEYLWTRFARSFFVFEFIVYVATLMTIIVYTIITIVDSPHYHIGWHNPTLIWIDVVILAVLNLVVSIWEVIQFMTCSRKKKALETRGMGRMVQRIHNAKISLRRLAGSVTYAADDTINNLGSDDKRKSSSFCGGNRVPRDDSITTTTPTTNHGNKGFKRYRNRSGSSLNGEMKGVVTGIWASRVMLHFNSLWNWIDIVTILLVWLLICLAILDNSMGPLSYHYWSISRCTLAIAALLMWLKALYFLRGFRSTAPFIRTMFLIIKDMSVFGIVVGLCVLGFGHSFLIVSKDLRDSLDQNKDISFHQVPLMRTFVLVYSLGVMGEVQDEHDRFEGDEGMVDEFSVIRWLIFFGCNILILVVLLNMVVAFMNNSFECAMRNATVALAKERLDLIMTYWHAVSYFNKKACPNPKWIHVIIRRDELNSYWSEVSMSTKEAGTTDLEKTIGQIDHRLRRQLEDMSSKFSTQLLRVESKIAGKTKRGGSGTPRSLQGNAKEGTSRSA